jgi:hypothetical protein
VRDRVAPVGVGHVRLPAALGSACRCCFGQQRAYGTRQRQRLLLLDHIGSTWPPIYAAQWLLERITIRAAGEHFTRRQLSVVQAAGFQVVETERHKADTVERIHAVKPA